MTLFQYRPGFITNPGRKPYAYTRPPRNIPSPWSTQTPNQRCRYSVAEVMQVVGASNGNAKLNEGLQLLTVVGAGNGSQDGQIHLWFVLGKPAEQGTGYFD